MIKPIPQDIDLVAFLDSYWHRASLAQYCQDKDLPTTGPKTALTERITAYLSGQKSPKIKSNARCEMPTIFTRDTVIGKNWRCTQDLRAFFQSQTETRFTFNKPMRDFIADGAGKTLAEALKTWEDTKNIRTETIEPQFEYNRFMRRFFEENKGADLSSAFTAWKTHRDTPKSQRTQL
jgi:hypothetical protein